jgi:hypothetical protein
VGLAIAVGSIVLAERAYAIEEIWQLPLQKDLQGRIYETSIVLVDEKRPVVLATTPDRVLSITDGQPATLFPLNREGAFGETAILPSPAITDTLQGVRIGLLLFQHHDVDSFRLVDLNGKTLLESRDPSNFHYRLAPDGSSFVAMDAGGEHAALTAETLSYSFFDATGKPIGQGEVRSRNPQPIDSAYAPDGAAFLINSGRDGLSSYSTADLSRIWNIPKDVRFFAPANGVITHAVISDANKRNVAQFFRTGQLQWTLSLDDFGVKENVRNLAISPNGEVIAVSSATLLLILGPESADPTGIFEVGKDLTINSLAVSDGGVVALGTQQAGLQDNEQAFGAVFILDRKGQLLLRQDTQHERSNAWIPMVQFDATGQFLLIRTLEVLTLLSIAEAE